MIHEKLKQYRKAHGLTQAGLAEKLDISQNTISQYESGKRNPSVKRLAELTCLLDCCTDDLIGVKTGESAQ